MEQSSKKSRSGLIILVAVSLILVGALLIFLRLRKKRPPESKPEPENESELPTPEKRIKDFYALVKNVFPDDLLSRFVTAQAMHETGIFTSPVYLNNNNAFGMKEPLKRPSTDLNYDESGYAEYLDVQDSIIDLLEWMNYVQFNQNVGTIQEYCKELKDHSYYTASYSNYVSAVNKNLTALNVLIE